MQVYIEKRATIETIINAASVAANGGTVTASYTPQGESEAWFVISTDQQPWSFRAISLFGGAQAATAVYPQKSNVATTPTITLPESVLLQLSSIALTNLADAVANRGVYPTTVQFTNSHASNVATVTVKLIRSWR